MMRDQKLWTWHILAGAVILVLLGLHMLTMHMEGVVKIEGLNPASAASEARGGEELHPIDWANVKARSAKVFYMVTYILLLGAALFHGLYGATNVVREANPPRWLQKTVSALAVVVGLGLFAFGTWAAIAAFLLAKAL